jgi:hypothetical protein
MRGLESNQSEPRAGLDCDQGGQRALRIKETFRELVWALSRARAAGGGAGGRR